MKKDIGSQGFKMEEDWQGAVLNRVLRVGLITRKVKPARISKTVKKLIKYSIGEEHSRQRVRTNV